jgi:hypothetical protein
MKPLWRSSLLTAIALLSVCATPARRLDAQEPAADMIAGARRQIDDVNADSALVLLNGALRQGLPEATRVRAYTLLAIAHLSNTDRASARAAFEEALKVDAVLRVDTLEELHSLIRVVFAEARARLGLNETPSLAVAMNTPLDTTVPVTSGRLLIEVRPTRRARVVLVVALADAQTPTWTDTSAIGGVATRSWDLRSMNGAVVASGRYSLRATATASAAVGQMMSQTVERILFVSRVPVDTQPWPLAPPVLPESIQVRGGTSGSVGLGLVFGAAAALLPSALGNSALKAGSDANVAAYAVAGGVSLTGIVGLFAGHRWRPLPVNAARNLEQRRSHQSRLAEVVAANRRTLEEAPIRIRVEGTSP